MRSPFYISTGILALLMFGSSVRADEALTVELPPSQNALDARAAAKSQAEAEAAASRSRAGSANRGQSAFSSRGALASRGQNSSERVMGQLGQLDHQAAIYRGRSSQTQRLTLAPAGTYLAIKDSSGDWYGVLMSDGSIGWIPRQNVHLLDYQVVSSGSAPMPDFGSGNFAPRTGSEFFRGDPQALLREAYKYLGVPYRWGGNTCDGIDCSGFVKNVFKTSGYPLPRTAAEQIGLGMQVSRDQLQAGDRIYFGKDRATHTGIYIGNGYFIHSSSGNHGVVISRLSESLYQRIYLSARR